MYGVTIGDKHTFDDFGLLLKKKPVIAPPEVKIIEIDIPGGDGKLDLSTVLNGYEVYYNRTITMEFNIQMERRRFYKLYSTIANYLHGKKFKIVMDDELDYYWYGRVTMNSMDIAYRVATLKLTADVEPYKLEVVSSAEPWKWDPFNFETGIIRDYYDLEVDGSLTLTLIGSRKPVIPSFTVSDDMTVTFEGVEYTLTAGTTKVINIEILESEYTLTFTGTGTLTIDYRGGSL